MGPLGAHRNQSGARWRNFEMGFGQPGAEILPAAGSELAFPTNASGGRC